MGGTDETLRYFVPTNILLTFEKSKEAESKAETARKVMYYTNDKLQEQWPEFGTR